MHIYRNIWLTPIKALSLYVGDIDNQSLAILPLIVAGTSMGMDMKRGFGSVFDTNEFLAIPAGLVVIALIYALLIPGLLILTGRIWKGKSSFRQMINIVSVSLIPQLLLLVYQLILMAVGDEPSLSNVNTGLEYVVKLWSFMLLIIGVAKIQHFNYPTAVMNIVISYLPFLLFLLFRSHLST